MLQRPSLAQLVGFAREAWPRATLLSAACALAVALAAPPASAQPQASDTLEKAQALAAQLRLEEATEALDRLVTANTLAGEERKTAVELMLHAALADGDYERAAKAARLWQAAYKGDEEADAAAFALALVGAAKPRAFIRNEVLPARRDRAGLYRTDLTLNGTTKTDVVIDTGANFSVITQSLAEAAGLSLRPTTVDVKASTGKVVQARLALANLDLGQSRFENAVFIVLPDEALSFPMGYRIPAILGLPQLRSLGAMRLDREHLTIRSSSGKSATPGNLSAEGLELFARLTVNDTPMKLMIDTGARSTALSQQGGAKLPRPEDAQTTTRKLYGAGGGTAMEAWVLNGPQVTIEGRQVKLSRLDVRSDPRKDGADGVLGQDVLSSQGGYEFDFDAMVLRLAPKP